MVNISTRADSFNKASLNKIGRADLIYFTGGDQLNVTSLFGGSPLHNLLEERIRNGVAIGGTSAGAAMMSGSMIITGRSDTGPKKGCVDIAPGLDLISDTIIDTHFSERGRYGRLLTAVAHHPQILGIGLDERTGIVVKGTQFRVVGEGSVIVVDGGNMTHDDLVYQRELNPIAMFDIRLHALASGYTFDMGTREPRAPAIERTRGATA
jgi:cyanophycinase